MWESGKVASDESILQDYKGPALQSGKRYFWQVRIWDNKGRSSKWSTDCPLGNGVAVTI